MLAVTSVNGGQNQYCEPAGLYSDKALKIKLLGSIASKKHSIISGHEKMINGELDVEITTESSVRLPEVAIQFKDIEIDNQIYRCAHKVTNNEKTSNHPTTSVF